MNDENNNMLNNKFQSLHRGKEDLYTITTLLDLFIKFKTFTFAKIPFV